MPVPRAGDPQVWHIGFRGLIEGRDEEEAERAIGALEATARRVSASVNINVHYSEPPS